MSIDNLKECIRKKRFLLDSFLQGCAGPSGASPDAALRHGVVSYYLQAVGLELIVKILFELDRREEAPHTHDLSRLFGKLSADTQESFQKFYEAARGRRSQQFEQIDDDVVFHPLVDVLANNTKIVRDFKYDAEGVTTNYAADGGFYEDVSGLIQEKLVEIDA